MIATHLFTCFSSSLRKANSLASGSCFIIFVLPPQSPTKARAIIPFEPSVFQMLARMSQYSVDNTKKALSPSLTIGLMPRFFKARAQVSQTARDLPSLHVLSGPRRVATCDQRPHESVHSR